MATTSAGILLYRRGDRSVEVLLVHPGGPFWAARDQGAWSIPKGEQDEHEEPYAAALREFAEELGSPAPQGDHVIELGEVRLKSGKRIRAWALEGDLDAAAITSNTFTLEWPPRSGRTIEVPEVDRAEWFELSEARVRLNPRQVPLVDRLAEALARPS
jgi:predicted NUDIX family NTP pyrophosphohydrolase